MEINHSLSILSAGLLDIIRDKGRIGYQQEGIPVNGAMDAASYFVANLLVGNLKNEACIEMTFPAAKISFNHTTYFALAGGNFDAHLNNSSIQSGKCYLAQKGDILQFKKQISGRFIYLSVAGGINVEEILKSKTTNLKGSFGGWFGRKLKNHDTLPINSSHTIPNTKIYLDYANTRLNNKIRCIVGPEFDLLDKKMQHQLFSNHFQLTNQIDTMAFTILGNKVLQNTFRITSSGVSEGTIQLLPNGNLLALMSDHQTTGGYPRILQIIRSDIRNLVHYPIQTDFQFEKISLDEAIQIEEEEISKRNKIKKAYLQTISIQ